MSRSSTACLALLALAGLVPLAFAQQKTVDTVNALTLDCGSSASRTSAPCSPGKDAVVLRHEAEIKTTIELPALKSLACEASVSFQYHQRDALARVEGTIANATCAASTGEYSVAIRIRDASGEPKTLDFHASWQRSDDRPISVAADYPIGANVDLVSVRARSLRCVCTEKQEAP